MIKRFGIVAVGPLLVITLVACGREDGVARASSSDASMTRSTAATTTTTTTPATTTTTYTPPPPSVTLTCYSAEDLGIDGSGDVGGGDVINADFSLVWKQRLTGECEASRNQVDLSPVEMKTLKAAGVGLNDWATLKTIYGLCAVVDPADPYAEPGFEASAEQIPEISAMLALCPKHPFAGKFRAAVNRGRNHARAEAAGELFYDGTYRVGADVKPGTYAIEGQIENCYWERTDANGEIIDNNFVLGAARVQVTIAAGDYSFTAQGCGEWTKVS